MHDNYDFQQNTKGQQSHPITRYKPTTIRDKWYCANYLLSKVFDVLHALSRSGRSPSPKSILFVLVVTANARISVIPFPSVGANIND